FHSRSFPATSPEARVLPSGAKARHHHGYSPFRENFFLPDSGSPSHSSRGESTPMPASASVLPSGERVRRATSLMGTEKEERSFVEPTSHNRTVRSPPVEISVLPSGE